MSMECLVSVFDSPACFFSTPPSFGSSPDVASVMLASSARYHAVGTHMVSASLRIVVMAQLITVATLSAYLISRLPTSAYIANQAHILRLAPPLASGLCIVRDGLSPLSSSTVSVNFASCPSLVFLEILSSSGWPGTFLFSER